jgi:predicted DNA-binding transcriptional regulator YafY
MIKEELNRFDRTLAILVILQSGKRITAQQLSNRFEVSMRTVYRDVRSLEAAGVPVIGEAGFGYSIMEGYRLPPVMFSREEAFSFVAAEKLMQKFTDAGLGANFESALNKVKSVLRGKEKDWVAVLEEKVWSTPKNELFTKNISNALEILFSSIAEQKQVYIEYQTLGASQLTKRHIEPAGIFHESSFWYLYAYCHLRKDYRQFRTDRILAIKNTDNPFSRKHDNMNGYTKESNDKEKTKVVIAVKKKVLAYLGNNKKYYGFVSEEENEDEMVMKFLTYSPMEGIARWYLMFGDHARIIEPEALRQRVKELTEKTIRRLSL